LSASNRTSNHEEASRRIEDKLNIWDIVEFDRLCTPKEVKNAL